MFDKAIPPLKLLLEKTPSADSKTLAALVLLAKGEPIGVGVLLRECEQRGIYRNMACAALANAKVTEIAPVIIRQLREYPVISSSKFPTTADDEVLTMLGALKQLRVELPDDIVRKYSTTSVPEFFQKAILEYTHPFGSRES